MNYASNVLTIPHATEDPSDAAQNMYRIVKGAKVRNVNLCGSFAVAYIAQDASHTNNIDEFLDYWMVNDPKWYASAFPGGKGRLTGVPDLDRMLGDYGYSVPSGKFYQRDCRTAEAMRAKLETDQAIVCVHIDRTGYLVGGGIPHWVVLDSLEIVNNRPIVGLYNPYTNNEEPYSWREFMNSSGAAKTGIWVTR